jgi:HSP20 family molecular chaperone IbpA
LKRNRFKQNQDVFKEYLFNLKELIQEFRGGFVQDLKETSSLRYNREEGKGLDFLPIEIWETKERYFIQTYLAALKDLSDVQIMIKDGHTLILRIYFSSSKPGEGCWMVSTEYPKFLQREITFLHTINDNSVTLQNGVLVIDLEKQIGDLEFPVAGEKDGNKIEEVVEEKV